MRYGRGSTITFLLLPLEWITESVERRAVTERAASRASRIRRNGPRREIEAMKK
jgi:hypothetical protein